MKLGSRSQSDLGTDDNGYDYRIEPFFELTKLQQGWCQAACLPCPWGAQSTAGTLLRGGGTQSVMGVSSQCFSGWETAESGTIAVVPRCRWYTDGSWDQGSLIHTSLPVSTGQAGKGWQSWGGSGGAVEWGTWFDSE